LFIDSPGLRALCAPKVGLHRRVPAGGGASRLVGREPRCMAPHMCRNGALTIDAVCEPLCHGLPAATGSHGRASALGSSCVSPSRLATGPLSVISGDASRWHSPSQCPQLPSTERAWHTPSPFTAGLGFQSGSKAGLHQGTKTATIGSLVGTADRLTEPWVGRRRVGESYCRPPVPRPLYR